VFQRQDRQHRHQCPKTRRGVRYRGGGGGGASLCCRQDTRSSVQCRLFGGCCVLESRSGFHTRGGGGTIEEVREQVREERRLVFPAVSSRALRQKQEGGGGCRQVIPHKEGGDTRREVGCGEDLAERYSERPDRHTDGSLFWSKGCGEVEEIRPHRQNYRLEPVSAGTGRGGTNGGYRADGERQRELGDEDQKKRGCEGGGGVVTLPSAGAKSRRQCQGITLTAGVVGIFSSSPSRWESRDAALSDREDRAAMRSTTDTSKSSRETKAVRSSPPGRARTYAQTGPT